MASVRCLQSLALRLLPRRALPTSTAPRHRLLGTASDANLKNLLRVSREVSQAVATNKPVVALESTIYTHGALGKTLSREHDELVRRHGGIPAIIGILDGVPSVGLTPAEVTRMIEDQGTVKASRRDISFLVGMGLAGRKINGGTTISGTMLLARLAGIRVFGTGGLGGVHRDGHNSMDVSADLTELGRTRVAVVSSGSKGFLDIPRTMEYLETQGCLVSTFSEGRGNKVNFPAFWARDSGVPSPSAIHTEKEAAAIVLAQERLAIESGMLFANPIPEEAAIPSAEMQAHIETAVRESVEKGFLGNANTPYILKRIKELVGDRAVTANKVLVKANIVRATKIAVELSQMLASGSVATDAAYRTTATPSQLDLVAPPEPQTVAKADIVVAGSVAVDLSCNFTSPKSGDVAPQLHVSNPAQISQSIGGVGCNVALAAHLASKQAKVKFCSLIGDDIAGSTIVSSLEAAGLDTSGIQRVDQSRGRTAQYVAVNDGRRDLVLAMADMGIFDTNATSEEWKSTLAAANPKWLVVDGNWSANSIRTWIEAGKASGSKVVFEPVSAEKSRRLFPPQKDHSKLRLFPEPSVDLASPNVYELSAMNIAARENDYFDAHKWFEVIDALGMTGARDRFVRLTSAALTDAGVPQQCMTLLPYIQNIVTKLGAEGVLLASLLPAGDPRLKDDIAEEFIVARAPPGHPSVGGVYMRLFPAAERIDQVVSVNGVGDTFLGVLVAGLAQGGRVEDLIGVAQKGAVLTLKSTESVSRSIPTLESELVLASRRS